MKLLSDLPAEILAKIMSFLSAIDLESCSLTNRGVRDVIDGSAFLHYTLAVHLAGVEDNPHSSLGIPEKLLALTQRERSWMRFEPDSVQTISVDQLAGTASGRCDLSNGDRFLGALGFPRIHHLQPETAPPEALAWSRFDLNYINIDMALAVYESDLAVVVTGSPAFDADEMDEVDIEIHLWSFKTGSYHPSARRPIILSGPYSGREPSASVEIVGDFLALATRYSDDFRPDMISVWNWKTGDPLIRANAAYGTHPSVVFLTGDILLVPNATAATLEFWRIPPSSDHGSAASRHPIHSIGLPALTTGTQISAISCRGERPCSTPNSGKPFQTAPQRAIIVFHVYIGSTFPDRRSTLALVVHRQSLVDLINKHLPQNSTEGIRQPLPWVDWGPSLTRWFVNDRASIHWVTTSAGQRFVSAPRGAAPSPITICDFNPHNVTKMKEYLKHHPNPNMFFNEGEEELEGVANIFEDPVRSALPYCCSRSEGLYAYIGILMDEERLLGFKTLGERSGNVSIEVMHFG